MVVPKTPTMTVAVAALMRQMRPNRAQGNLRPGHMNGEQYRNVGQQ